MKRHLLVLISALLAMPFCVAGITMNQPEDGEVLEGPQQPDGSVAIGDVEQGDEVLVNWANNYPGAYASGVVSCNEGWNQGQWFETDWYASNSFNLEVNGTWMVQAQHLRGTQQLGSVVHNGATTGVE